MHELLHLFCPCHIGLDDLAFALGALSWPLWLSAAFRVRRRR